MLIHTMGATLVYTDAAKAQGEADKLNAARKHEGVTFNVHSRVKGKFLIECIDKEGDFIGYM